jgi:hypothetical protein
VRTQKTKGKSRAGLTATQIIILQHAIAGPVLMMRGDRLGTRCVGYEEETGAAKIIAYSRPEFFLTARGFLRPRNSPHYYDLTDAGREAISKVKP